MKKLLIIFYEKLLKISLRFGILLQVMKKIPITSELIQRFRLTKETLIMEGYCKNYENVTVYNDGDNYAVIAVDYDASVDCCLYASNVGFIDEVVSSFDCGAVEFCGVSAFVTDYLKSKYKFIWETDCYLYVWNGKDLSYKCKCDLRPIDGQYAQQISDGTHYHAAIDDIKICLKIHPSSAAYADGKPVCWCLLHREGSLGMLYTLPEYRRQGYALEVMTDITNKVIAKGNIPFAYIVTDNFASQNLAAKYNLAKHSVANYFEIDFGANI